MAEPKTWCQFCSRVLPLDRLALVDIRTYVCDSCHIDGYPRKDQRVVGNCHECHGDIYDWQKMTVSGGWKYHIRCYTEDEMRNETEVK